MTLPHPAARRPPAYPAVLPAVCALAAALAAPVPATAESVDERRPAAEPVLLGNLQPGQGGSWPRELRAAHGRLYFSASDSGHGREPWVAPPPERCGSRTWRQARTALPRRRSRPSRPASCS